MENTIYAVEISGGEYDSSWTSIDDAYESLEDAQEAVRFHYEHQKKKRKNKTYAEVKPITFHRA